MAQKLYDISVRTITGKPVTLSEYRGKVLLIVNVASECGLTPQYAGLESIYEKFHGRGFEVLGFPANEFGAQEPGSNSQIHEFCRTQFGVKFPMFEKIVVKGEGQHPLYGLLTETQPQAKLDSGQDFEKKLESHGLGRAKKIDILWNFEKFLVNREGDVVERFAPDILPDSPMVLQAIEDLL